MLQNTDLSCIEIPSLQLFSLYTHVCVSSTGQYRPPILGLLRPSKYPSTKGPQQQPLSFYPQSISSLSHNSKIALMMGIIAKITPVWFPCLPCLPFLVRRVVSSHESKVVSTAGEFSQHSSVKYIERIKVDPGRTFV